MRCPRWQGDQDLATLPGQGPEGDSSRMTAPAMPEERPNSYGRGKKTGSSGVGDEPGAQIGRREVLPEEKDQQDVIAVWKGIVGSPPQRPEGQGGGEG
jgi:hypothetical protein